MQSLLCTLHADQIRTQQLQNNGNHVTSAISWLTATNFIPDFIPKRLTSIAKVFLQRFAPYQQTLCGFSGIQ